MVDVDPKHHKLTVTGYVEPKTVLRAVRGKTGKKVELGGFCQAWSWRLLHVELDARLHGVGGFTWSK